VFNCLIMIRKVIHITLIMLLLSTTAGMTIFTHFCGSQFEKISINVEPESCCGDDSSCCHNETVIVKIHDNFSIPSINIDFQRFALVIPAILPHFVEVPSCGNRNLNIVNDLPPPLVQTKLSLLQAYRL